MKKVILTLATAFLTFSMNAQITIKAEPKTEVVWQATKLSSVPNVTMFDVNGDMSYALYYKNAEYQHITDIDYINLGNKETALQFFEILKDVCSSGNNVIIDLDGHTWTISKMSYMVSVYRSGSFFYLTRKYVESAIEGINK